MSRFSHLHSLTLCFLWIAGAIGCHVDSRVEAPASAVQLTEPRSIKPRSVMPDPPPAQLVRLPPRELGRSLKSIPILAYEFDHRIEGRSGNSVLIFAGIHGNETTTVYAANQLVELLQRSAAELVPAGTRVVVVPLVNPDGYAVKKRQNAARVDLNRNFPAKNWKQTPPGMNWNGPSPLSEPESRVIHDLVLELRPLRILSLHSIRPPRHGNNFDGPARELAELLASHNHYAVLPTMGYPTPGSFGSWAGIDLNIPTITLEFPSNESGPKAWSQNRDAILAFIRGR